MLYSLIYLKFTTSCCNDVGSTIKLVFEAKTQFLFYNLELDKAFV